MAATVDDQWEPGLYLAEEFPRGFSMSPQAHAERPLDPGAVFEDTEAVCFICKKQLFRSSTPNAGNYTREDVFPQWMTEHFELPSEYIDFPDGTFKTYKQVLVPCCVSCNGKWMSQVENRIRSAVTAPDQYKAFTELKRSDVALWTMKIMYGLLHTRIAPWNFNKHKPRPATVTDTMLDHFRLSLILLDGFRKRVVIAGAFPSSILILPIKPGATGELAYDYQDNLQYPAAIAMRMGTVGLICVFEDFGIVENYYRHELAPLVGDHALHPLQFMEIAARVFDGAGQVMHTVSYSAMEGPRDVYLTLRGNPSSALEPDDERLVGRIARMTRDDEALKRPASATLLVGRTGQFLDLPWPPAEAD